MMVRYKVKADKAQENIDYIQNVFRALNEAKPENFRYASFQLDDGLTFVHIASIETGDGSNPLPEFDEFKAFRIDLASRCDEPPVSSAIETLGNYQVFE